MNKLTHTDFFRLITEHLHKKESVIDLNINYSQFEDQLMTLISNQIDNISLYRTLNYTLRELKALHAKVIPFEAKKK